MMLITLRYGWPGFHLPALRLGDPALADRLRDVEACRGRRCWRSRRRRAATGFRSGATKLPAALLTSPVSPPDCPERLDHLLDRLRRCGCRRRRCRCGARETAGARPRRSRRSTALRRPQIATSAPRRRNCSAIAWPRPVPPPVTRMRWPANSCDRTWRLLSGAAPDARNVATGCAASQMVPAQGPDDA